ncbi:putative U-box domain-containing protein 34-like, partial [Capsicum annuum]
MASLINPPLTLPQNKLNPGGVLAVSTSGITNKIFQPSSTRWNHRRCLLMRAKTSVEMDMLAKESVGTNAVDNKDFGVVSMHHVGVLCENLERSLDFYQNILGLKINEARPHDKLPYRGAWLWVGTEMIHLMELPNPDPLTGRPEHGGRDRHTCIAIRDVSKLKAVLDKAGIPYSLSHSGRPAIFTRD